MVSEIDPRGNVDGNPAGDSSSGCSGTPNFPGYDQT
jgi:hypothetical protein